MGKFKTASMKKKKNASRSSVPHSLDFSIQGPDVNMDVIWMAPLVLDYQQLSRSSANMQIDFDGDTSGGNRPPTPAEALLVQALKEPGSGGLGNVTVTRVSTGWIWHDAALVGRHIDGGVHVELAKRVRAAEALGWGGEFFSSLQELLWTRELQNNATLRSDLNKLVA